MVYLTKHHKHCQLQIWTSIAKAKWATRTSQGLMRYNVHSMPQDAINLLQVCMHSCHMLQVAIRFSAYRMLHASYCLLLVTCCILHAVCFNSKCCNRGRNAIYVSCFLYPASATLPHAASCMLCAAGCMSIDVPPCAAILDDTLHTAHLLLVSGSWHSDCMLFTGSLCC